VNCTYTNIDIQYKSVFVDGRANIVFVMAKTHDETLHENIIQTHPICKWLLYIETISNTFIEFYDIPI
jgi:L-rhamnose mutarotase